MVWKQWLYVTSWLGIDLNLEQEKYRQRLGLIVHFAALE
jgi:hypothetical protein